MIPFDPHFAGGGERPELTQEFARPAFENRIRPPMMGLAG
jgi:hypothetical protein